MAWCGHLSRRFGFCPSDDARAQGALAEGHSFILRATFSLTVPALARHLQPQHQIATHFHLYSTPTCPAIPSQAGLTTNATMMSFRSKMLQHASRGGRLYSSTSRVEDRIVIAVGGNALQRRGERLTIENMLKAAADMAPTISELASKHELVLTHGNGPQVGELALERSAATFDVLGAESMGQIGYVLAQALASVGTNAVPILTQVVVDPASEAFKDPSKFVGPIYGAKEAQALAQSLNWTVKADGEYFRRVVPSPPPLEILQIEAVKTLLEHAKDVLPIACGGGGVPVARVPSCPSTLVGVEAVIDKDICGAKLACDLNADGYIILTDGGGKSKTCMFVFSSQ